MKTEQDSTHDTIVNKLRAIQHYVYKNYMIVGTDLLAKDICSSLWEIDGESVIVELSELNCLHWGHDINLPSSFFSATSSHYRQTKMISQANAFPSSCACAKSHPGLCSLMKYSIVWMILFAKALIRLTHARADLSICCLHADENPFSHGAALKHVQSIKRCSKW